MKGGVLYISYDGMLEPLGQSQVLSYIERLSADRRIHVLSFEKAGDWRDLAARRQVEDRMRAAGIAWHPLPYHKYPSALATAWDIFAGTGYALWLAFRYQLGIVHARSYVAAVMALMVKRVIGRRFLFDMRGFWVDERVDGGLWPRQGRMYRVGKWVERRLLLGADRIITLTKASVRELGRLDYLRDRTPHVTVIPTCVDLARFHPGAVSCEHFVLGYVGSVGTWYLFEEVARAFALLRLRIPDAHFLILNRNDHGLIRRALDSAGIPAAAVDIIAAEHKDVPGMMARMNAGIFFIRPVFSKQASAPTKLAEFLGCGIPCLANAGVGDMTELFAEARTGVVVHAFDQESLAKGVDRLLDLTRDPGVRQRCVQTAEGHFSLAHGVEIYRKIYEALEQQ
ncbi:MAG: glycosyltransferase [Lysobacteraceae bacterium]|nr:MAG: glycosyltransferase [Xanthomonadaceae bacterium]